MVEYQYSVCVHCWTYNHSRWIEEALNGFCNQETDFPFVCTIVDDYSNDGEPDLLNNYLEAFFDLHNDSVVLREETSDYSLTFAQHRSNKNCFFAVYLLKYNHHQIRKSKFSYLMKWNALSKYVALCEGDDYWISPHKLQMQVDFLEDNIDYTMVCNRTKLYSERKQKFVGENYCYNRSRTVDVKDIIYRTGLFISTCSVVYRSELLIDRPDYWIQCRVGDYPLQIGCAMKGKVYYFNSIMSVYRVDNSNSWMGQQKWGKLSKERLEVIKSRVEMLKGFQKDYPGFSRTFGSKIADEINRNVPGRFASKEDADSFVSFFSDEIKHYSWRWKIDLWFRRCRIPIIRGIYTRLFLRKFFQRKHIY